MKVYQIRMKLFLLEDIAANKIQEKITAFIDLGFKTDEKWLNFHEQNSYKNYCYDQLFPLEEDKLYKKEKIYTLTIRTVDLTHCWFRIGEVFQAGMRWQPYERNQGTSSGNKSVT